MPVTESRMPAENSNSQGNMNFQYGWGRVWNSVFSNWKFKFKFQNPVCSSLSSVIQVEESSGWSNHVTPQKNHWDFGCLSLSHMFSEDLHRRTTRSKSYTFQYCPQGINYMNMFHVCTFNGIVQPLRMLDFQAICFGNSLLPNQQNTKAFQGYPGVM